MVGAEFWEWAQGEGGVFFVVVVIGGSGCEDVLGGWEGGVVRLSNNGMFVSSCLTCGCVFIKILHY